MGRNYEIFTNLKKTTYIVNLDQSKKKLGNLWVADQVLGYFLSKTEEKLSKIRQILVFLTKFGPDKN